MLSLELVPTLGLEFKRELELEIVTVEILELRSTLELVLDLGPVIKFIEDFVRTLELGPEVILVLGPEVVFTLEVKLSLKFVRGVEQGLEKAAVREEICLFFSKNSM